MNLSFISKNLPGERVKSHNLLDLITKHFDANRKLFVHRNDLDRISTYSKCAALECDVIALVLDIDKAAKEGISFNLIPHLEVNHAIDVLLRCA